MTLSINRITNLLRSSGFDVLVVATGLSEEPAEQPMIVFNRQSYPGVEAHVVTAAHCALWIPKLDDNGNVIVYYPQSSQNEDHLLAWGRLLGVLDKLTDLLHTYRNRVLTGHLSGVIWAHHEIEWHRALRRAPFHEQQNTSNFIDYVDPSIRNHITVLNDYGFDTIESCSGLPQDHPDRDPYRPYVMLNERAYTNCVPHFFTLADIADWIPSYAPHNFDVYIRIQRHNPVREAWNRLVQSARNLHLLLKPYRQFVRSASCVIDENNFLLDSLSTTVMKR
ncbi:MAG: hypothetical protein RTU63_05495 [Candidatus Thorarchaeota archaeon]